MKRITAVASGMIQGVGYRYFVTGCAQEAGVSGFFLMNMTDGSVLMVAEGGEEALAVFKNLSGLQAIRLSGSMISLLVRVKPPGSSPGSG